MYACVDNLISFAETNTYWPLNNSEYLCKEKKINIIQAQRISIYLVLAHLCQIKIVQLILCFMNCSYNFQCITNIFRLYVCIFYTHKNYAPCLCSEWNIRNSVTQHTSNCNIFNSY